MRSLLTLRQDARTIFDAALQAVEPVHLIEQSLHRQGDKLDVTGECYDLSNYRRIFIIGAGKAAGRMASALETMLGSSITGGIVIVKYGHSVGLQKIRLVEAGHPIPDKAGADATTEMMSIAEKATEEDLILCLLSGGASALMLCPAENVSLQDKQATTRLLLDCGAKIQEINAIRKHISQVKGGWLAGLAYPATVVSLILSDVIGDPIESIASGPTAPDRSTFSDCWRIIDQFGLAERIPGSVRDFLQKGVWGSIAETPKPGDPIFEKVHNVIIGNNRTALFAAKEQADELGFNTIILSGFIEGEAREAAIFHTAI